MLHFLFLGGKYCIYFIYSRFINSKEKKSKKLEGNVEGEKVKKAKFLAKEENLNKYYEP